MRIPNALLNNPLLLAQIMFSLPVIHVSLRLLGFGRTLDLLKKLPHAAALVDDHDSHHSAQAVALGRLVNAVAIRLRMSCLDRSALLWWLLRRQGAPATLYLGAPHEKGDQFEAHAWVECGGAVVNDAPRVRSRYAVLTTYENL